MPKPIFHLALVDDWQRAVDQKKTYYPPTYKTDGFTHATAEPARLLDVANHFYADTTGDWLCLRMTEESLAAEGIAIEYESAAPVGEADGKIEGTKDVLFPHIQGGIPVSSVIATHAVLRDRKGRFLDIDLCVEI
ncbi:MAG: DUF952 domain-containing protein [Gammaproteobacteria bacterium]|nr:DUF952 domain-containing protein [Gammaproteobacteria bacterium]